MGTSKKSKDIQERKEERNLEDMPSCGSQEAVGGPAHWLKIKAN